jgi:hypothetical protein
MFSSSFFNPEYFNEYFKVIGDPIPILADGGGGSKGISQRRLRQDEDDQDILDFIVTFVLNRRS